MTIIFGESQSGKTSLALQMIKRSPRAIYITLDSDKSLIEKVDKAKNNIELKPIDNPFIIDIEMEILQNGGLKNNITHLIIDPINHIRQSNVDYFKTEKVDNLKNIISSLEYIELTYNIKVIAIYNVLRNVDKTRSDIMEYGKTHSLIATTKNTKSKIKRKVKKRSYERG